MCKIKDCKLKVRSRGMCLKHYCYEQFGTCIWCPGPRVARKHELCGNCYKRGKRPKQPPDQIGYEAAHLRLRKARGRAVEHVCRCGEQASQWALKKESTDLLTQVKPKWGKEDTLRYSLVLDNYMPLCFKCHYMYDRHETN